MDVTNLAVTVTTKVSEAYPSSDSHSTTILPGSLPLTTQVPPVEVSLVLVISPYCEPELMLQSTWRLSADDGDVVAVSVIEPPVEIDPLEMDPVILIDWTPPSSGSTAWMTNDLVSSFGYVPPWT